MPSFYPKSRILRERLVPADTIRRLDGAFNLIEAQLEPVETPPDLENLYDHDLIDGSRAVVTQGQETFYLDRASVAVPDGSTIIATQSDEGRWLIMPTSSGSGMFEADAVNNEIQPISAQLGRSFVIGSDSTESGGSSDRRMFFSKADGSLRAGEVDAAQWNIANRGEFSFAAGQNNTASGKYSTAVGYGNLASGDNSSHVEGYGCTASGTYGSHAEGRSCSASGNYGSHAEGYNTTASGDYASHAEGFGTQAQAASSHAEGNDTVASSESAHAEGNSTVASGQTSHAEGSGSIAGGQTSHAEGFRSRTYHRGQHAGSSGTFVDIGDAQYSRMTLLEETSDATQTALSISNTSVSPLDILGDRSWTFLIYVTGRQVGGSAGTVGNTGSYKAEGCIKRIGGAVTLVGAATVTTLGEDDASWDVEVDAYLTALRVRVKGVVNQTIRWCASLHLTEVAE